MNNKHHWLCLYYNLSPGGRITQQTVALASKSTIKLWQELNQGDFFLLTWYTFYGTLGSLKRGL